MGAPVSDLIDMRIAYADALPGALERRDLPRDIGEAFQLAGDLENRRPFPMHARIREAQLEAHRLAIGAA